MTLKISAFEVSFFNYVSIIQAGPEVMVDDAMYDNLADEQCKWVSIATNKYERWSNIRLRGDL